MNKKFLFLLPLFLLLPAATQCMEKEIVIIPKTIQEIRDERDKFKKELDANKYFWWFSTTTCPNYFFLSCTYRQDLHKETYRKRASHLVPLKNILDEKWFRIYNIDELPQLPADQIQILKEVRFPDTLYSCLGSATMAENVSYQDKKQFIQKLLGLHFTPTPGDKELALLTKYEEFGPSIIKIFLNLQNSLFLSEMDLPQEIIPLITLLMFETEKSLL
jgi:hypothetical protein